MARKRPVADLPLNARVTLTDVAARAGVSRQTASRVARGGELVNTKTAERVRSVIEELGYQPNIVARALSVGSARQLGVITHTEAAYGPNATLAAIEVSARQAGYRMIVAHLADFSPQGVQASVDDLVRIGCDGIVLLAPWAGDAQALQELVAHVPIVTTSRIPGFDGPATYIDAYAAAVSATEHLLDLGHETVHHVAGPAQWNAANWRLDGWRTSLQSAGRSVPEVIYGDWSSDSGAQAAAVLLRDPSVTAVLVASDQMALGLLFGLAEAGCSVPADISVVGFDDAPGSAHFQPPLTTVRGDAVEHGRRTVATLLRQLGHDSGNDLGPVEPTLLVRKSTAPPRLP